MSALSHRPTLRLTDIAVKEKSRCTWAVILIFLTFARSMRGNNFISKYFVEFVLPNALLKKGQVALATEQFIAKFKILLFNVFLSILNSCSTDIRIFDCSHDETKSKMKSNPGLLLECTNDDYLIIFQSHRGIWSNWIQVRSWKSCGEIIDCTERKDIVNRYKMPKYLVRFVITFWIKSNFAFFQGQFSYTKSAFRPT